jgi:PhnB protein
MPQNPPENFPRLTPLVFYNDVATALDWLAKSFGFEKRVVMPGPDGSIMHAEMQLKDAVIMMGPPSDERETKSAADLPAVSQSLYVPGRRSRRSPKTSSGATASTTPGTARVTTGASPST